ncbi:MAG: arsenic resistance protein [Pseudomonadota bacterium]
MLTQSLRDAGEFMSGRGAAAALIGAIVLGSVFGIASPERGAALAGGIDMTLLVFVFLLLFEVRFQNLLSNLGRVSFIATALVANFVVIPLLGFVITSIFLVGHPLFFIGLLIYFSAPCTDWFLGFTRLAKGNTALGAALLPINLIVQLLLYPVYLNLFGVDQIGTASSDIAQTVWQWFLLPLVAAVGVRAILERLLKQHQFDLVLSIVSILVPILLALLVGQICAANITALVEHATIVPLILCAIFLFFSVTFLLSEGLSKLLGLAYEDRVLLTMTTAARNAPLMLVLTLVAIPDQPIVYAALIIGMLVELPHLVALKAILERSRLSGNIRELSPTSGGTPTADL